MHPIDIIYYTLLHIKINVPNSTLMNIRKLKNNDTKVKNGMLQGN